MKTFNKIFASFFLSLILFTISISAFSYGYGADTKTARMNTTLAQIDLGSGPAKLQIGTSGMAIICLEYTLDDPAGTVVGPDLFLSGFPKVTTATANCSPAAEGRIVDSDNNVVINNLSVGTSGTAVIIGNTSVIAGMIVTAEAVPVFHHF